MKKFWLLAVTATFLCIATLSIAQMGQEQQTQRDQSGQQQFQSDRSDQQSQMQQQQARGSYRASEGRVVRLSELRKKDVTNWRNEDLGEITDFVIDKRQGRIVYAVLSYGGAIGLGTKRFAVAWDSLSLTPDGRDFVIDVPKQTFEQGQGFDDRWPAQPDRTLTFRTQQNQQQYSRGPQNQNYYGMQSDQGRYGQSRQDYYGSQYGQDVRDQQNSQSGQNYSSGREDYYGPREQPQNRQGLGMYGTQNNAQQRDIATAEGRQQDQSRQPYQRSRGDELSQQHPNLERASEVIGQDVVNMQDEDLGEIHDLMVDLREGRIVYAVLAHGGFLAIGEKLVPVPWTSLGMRTDRDEIMMDATKDKIANAPSFSRDNWPDMSDQRWGQNVFSYFGQRPYWQVYGYQSYIGQQQQGAWDANSSYTRKFDQSKMQTIQGKVTNISTFRPEKGAEPGYRVKVETDDGKTVRAHLGPKALIDKQGIQLKTGDRIKLTGSMTRIGGREILMSCDLEANGKTVQLRTSDGQPCWGMQNQGQRSQQRQNQQGSRQEQQSGQQPIDQQLQHENRQGEIQQDSQSQEQQNNTMQSGGQSGQVNNQLSTDMNSPGTKDANSVR